MELGVGANPPGPLNPHHKVGTYPVFLLLCTGTGLCVKSSEATRMAICGLCVVIGMEKKGML